MGAQDGNKQVSFPFFILHCLKEHLILEFKDYHFPMKYNSKTRILYGKNNYF